LKKGNYNCFGTVKGNSDEFASERKHSNNMPKDFNRDVYAAMHAWKDCCATNKVALVVNGARQIGKTHCINKYTKEHFDKVYYADFFRKDFRDKAESIPGRQLTTLQIVETLFPDFEDREGSVIVLDEIQEYADMYNMIRPINRDMSCHLIVSGSFLGRTLNRGFITPTGDTRTIRMYGLSFPEFLGGLGIRELYDNADLFGGSDVSVYEQLRKAFDLYCFIGGYPKVVEQFLFTQNKELAESLLEELVSVVCEETSRYFGEIQDVAKLNRLLNGVANLLVREKRGDLKLTSELGRIVEGTNKRSITNALHWFWKSGILEPCGRVNDCDPSMITPESLFYFADLGIANHLYEQLPVQESNVYGAICENFAYACIRDMKGVIPKEPCFGTYGPGELDYLFFVKSGGKVIPIGVEVKGGKDAGNTARELLKNGKIAYLINAKVDTKGGYHENTFTIPLPLLGKFNIFNYIPKDDVIAHSTQPLLGSHQKSSQ